MAQDPNFDTVAAVVCRTLRFNADLLPPLGATCRSSGLGRYGDALNPWGDVLAAARAWCMTRLGGRLVVAVPSGPDSILFNVHRVYGKMRYRFLATNWQLLEDGRRAPLSSNASSGWQPVHVFTRLPQ